MARVAGGLTLGRSGGVEWQDRALPQRPARQEAHARLLALVASGEQRACRWFRGQDSRLRGRRIAGVRTFRGAVGARGKPVGRRRPGPRSVRSPPGTFALRLAMVREHVSRYGHARVPQQHRLGNFALGQWVKRQRQRFRQGLITAEQSKALGRLPGVPWATTSPQGSGL